MNEEVGQDGWPFDARHRAYCSRTIELNSGSNFFKLIRHLKRKDIKRILRWTVSSLGVSCSILIPTSGVSSQIVGLLLPPIIDPIYNRDRNISVMERDHSDYDPLGIHIASFILHPSIAISSVSTSNVYLDDGNKKSDVYADIQPIVSMDSNWSNHYIGATAAGDIRRYASQSLRNQNAWYVYTQGRLDVTSETSLAVNAQLDKTYESPYFEDVTANLTSPSTYLRKFVSAQYTYQPGRVRIRAAVDISNFNFNTLEFADKTSRSQSYRDRSVYRASGVYEYALSPSLSVYAQAVYDKTHYLDAYFDIDTLIGLQPNRSSNGVNFIAGANFDLAGLARGTIGIGYSRRNYDASYFYKAAQGLSAQAKLEFFPSDYTTIGLDVGHQLLDSSLGNSGAYWNNALSFNVDREIRDNFIVSTNVQLIHRTYVESSSSTSVYQFQATGKYQASRALGFNANVSYGFDSTHGPNIGDPFHELRGTVGVRIRV